MMLPETQGQAMPSPQQYPSVLSSVLAWFRNRATAPSPGPDAPRVVGLAAMAPAGLARGYNIFNGGLLLRCMDLLAIDRSELAQEDPLLFRELQGHCATCCSRPTCARELAQALDDEGWDAWRAYCPNSSTLLAIGALQNCARAAQQIRMPRASTDPA
jgi:hypothetical protein